MCKKVVNYYVNGIDYDKSKKTVYVSITDYGLFTYNLQTHSLHLETNVIKDAYCLKVSNSGKLWLGTNNGLYFYEEKYNTVSQNLIPRRVPVVSICEDKKGVLWIGSDGGGV